MLFLLLQRLAGYILLWFILAFIINTIRSLSFDTYASHGNLYDIYVLELTWGGSICQLNDCKHTGLADVFNIHGLWPSNESVPPENCYHLNFKQDDMLPDLRRIIFDYWNSFYQNNWKFIHHELEKHGTCWDPIAGDTQKMPLNIKKIIETYDPQDRYSSINIYMQITIELAKTFNPFRILETNNITPDDRTIYHIAQINNAFAQFFRHEELMLPLCRKKPNDQDSTYLLGSIICFDLEYNPIKCVDWVIEYSNHSCITAWISYPLFPKQGTLL